MDQERLSFLALHLIPGVGDHLIRQLIGYCGSAEEVFKKPKGKLMKIPGVGEVTANGIKRADVFLEAERELASAEKEGVQILFFNDKQFPSRLKLIDDAPSILYWKGNASLEHPRTIALVGTRQATDYGKQMVERILEELIPYQPLIVSGLAYGIDIHAHKVALKHNLLTIGVMGSGMDVIYPATHRDTAHRMMEHGGLLTENRFGTKPDAHNFPARNRIIAGLCDVLIVVEAADTGGALITAEIANSYNKDVFAVPGGLTQTYSIGCNTLIKTNKAHLYSSAKDLEYISNWSLAVPDSLSTVAQPSNWSSLSFDEQAILTVMKLKEGAVQIDELAWKTGMAPGALASLLLTLEFKNLVKSLPGKLYRMNR